jgi:hypothetical protein
VSRLVKAVVTRGNRYRNILIKHLLPIVREQLAEARNSLKSEENLPVRLIYTKTEPCSCLVVCQLYPIYGPYDTRQAVLDPGKDYSTLRESLACWRPLGSHGKWFPESISKTISRLLTTILDPRACREFSVPVSGVYRASTGRDWPTAGDEFQCARKLTATEQFYERGHPNKAIG